MHVNIAIIGPAKSGKTCLAESLVDDESAFSMYSYTPGSIKYPTWVCTEPYNDQEVMIFDCPSSEPDGKIFRHISGINAVIVTYSDPKVTQRFLDSIPESVSAIFLATMDAHTRRRDRFARIPASNVYYTYQADSTQHSGARKRMLSDIVSIIADITPTAEEANSASDSDDCVDSSQEPDTIRISYATKTITLADGTRVELCDSDEKQRVDIGGVVFMI